MKRFDDPPNLYALQAKSSKSDFSVDF